MILSQSSCLLMMQNCIQLSPTSLQPLISSLLWIIYSVGHWSDHWQLKLSPSKCTVMHLTSPKTNIANHLCNAPYSLCGLILPSVSTVTDLGVCCDKNFSFRPHINHIVAKASPRACLPDRQSAYRAFHSTETAVFRVLSDILLALDSGNLVMLTLLDLSAAFDSVDIQHYSGGCSYHMVLAGR